MAVTNTLAYYDTETIVAVQSFTVQAPGVKNEIECEILNLKF
jgi:hypothetical protein